MLAADFQILQEECVPEVETGLEQRSFFPVMFV